MLIGLLRRAAERTPERPVLLSAGGPLSYAEGVARAEAVARGLAAGGIDRFAVAVDDPADALVAVAASTVIGAEACLYPRDVDPARSRALARSFGHETIIVAGRAAPAAPATWTPDDLAADGPAAPAVCTLDELATTAPVVSAAEPDRFPVLVLTTGTTGAPKGARHDWARLAGRVRAAGGNGDERWLLAHDLHQFAGLQVLLHVLATGATLVAPAGRGPGEAIAEIRRHRVTHVSATPTFWRLLAGALDAETAAELPIVQITLGGEAAPESLLGRLRELFPGARISHVYAGTEFGSVVSVHDGHAGLPESVLERPDDAGAQVRILDGELEVRSRVGMLGYHGEPDGEQGWRPTGDLVELRGGRIHFVGRRSEIINVGGAKVHPLPIEELVASVEGVALAAAYGRASPVTGQIVALDVVAAAGADPAAVEAAVREACESLPRPARPLRVRFVEALEIRGHKLIRRREGARP